ncbi:unnamed protein product [Peronospora destructor]|uniref:Uncharacterized protein n=1 Tax=Peronospora destructor TaxID=86335 RepID=A0AAV0SU00_9STRA|nr:unnamed protein product [Peronospora destructor]
MTKESTVSAKLKALMRYTESAYGIQVYRLVQGWLQHPSDDGNGSSGAIVMETLNETIEAHSERDKVLTASQPALQSVETVETLLDFCFLHVEQLASYSLLCAAKMHALAMRTQRSAMKLSQEEVLSEVALVTDAKANAV